MANLNNAKFNLNSSQATAPDEDFDNPLDLTDILEICKEYSQLGSKIQNQIELITEIGIEEAIKNGSVKVVSLPFIKSFLKAVSNNPLFGDAAEQCVECVALIEIFEMNQPAQSMLN